jgi:hypothetical protein
MSGQATGLLLGTKYQPSLFYFPVFKFSFWLIVTFFLIFMAIKSFDVLKVGFYIFHREFLGVFFIAGHTSFVS